MLFINSFLILQIHNGAVTKIEVVSNNIHKSEHNLVTLRGCNSLL